VTKLKVVLIAVGVGCGVLAGCNMGPEELPAIEASEHSQPVVVAPAGTCTCIAAQGWTAKMDATNTCTGCGSSADCSAASCVITKDSDPRIEQRSTCKYKSGTVADPEPVEPAPLP
jgi:hypothetical protein